MDLNQFFSQLTSAPSGAFNSRYCNQDLLEQVRELAYQGLKLFPVNLCAKLAGDQDRLIASATDDILLLQELLVAAQPLWGHRLALGPSDLCVLILEGALGRASFAALVPDLDDCRTLQARRGDAAYAFFRQPAGMKRIASARMLAPGVSLLGDGMNCIVPPSGGAVWANLGTDIEALPYPLRELLVLASESPDSPPGRAMPVPKPSSPRLVPCRSTVYFPARPDKTSRRGNPVCGQCGGYRISRRR